MARARTGRGLVDKREVRLLEKEAGPGQPLLLPAGQHCRPVAGVAELPPRRRVSPARCQCGVWSVRTPALCGVCAASSTA